MLAYPSNLPPPSGAPSDRPAERRDMSGRPGAFAVAPRSRERLGTVEITWVLRGAEVPAWLRWWELDLRLGGAWFHASWPSREGAAAARGYRFASEPVWTHAGRGIWRVAAQMDYRPGVITTD